MHLKTNTEPKLIDNRMLRIFRNSILLTIKVLHLLTIPTFIKMNWLNLSTIQKFITKFCMSPLSTQKKWHSSKTTTYLNITITIAKSQFHNHYKSAIKIKNSYIFTNSKTTYWKTHNLINLHRNKMSFTANTYRILWKTRWEASDLLRWIWDCRRKTLKNGTKNQTLCRVNAKDLCWKQETIWTESILFWMLISPTFKTRNLHKIADSIHLKEFILEMSWMMNIIWAMKFREEFRSLLSVKRIMILIKTLRIWLNWRSKDSKVITLQLCLAHTKIRSLIVWIKMILIIYSLLEISSNLRYINWS